MTTQAEATVSPDVTGQLAYSGSIVVRPQCVERLANDLLRVAPELSWHAMAALSSGMHQRFENLGDPANLRNPKSEQIDAIAFIGALPGDDEAARIVVGLSRFTPTIVASWSGVGASTADVLQSTIRSEIRNSRAFYWPVTLFGAWLRTGWRSPVLALAVIASLVAPCIQNRSTPERPDSESPAATAQQEIRSFSPTSGGWLAMRWREYGGVIVGASIVLVVLWLFPQGVFAIGDGIDRYDSLVRWRYLLFSAFALRGLSELFW